MGGRLLKVLVRCDGMERSIGLLLQLFQRSDDVPFHQDVLSGTELGQQQAFHAFGVLHRFESALSFEICYGTFLHFMHNVPKEVSRSAVEFQQSPEIILIPSC